MGNHKPHLHHKAGLWSCFKRSSTMMLRVGRGFTMTTAYDYWQAFPRYLVNCDTGHIMELTPVSNSTHVVTE